MRTCLTRLSVETLKVPQSVGISLDSVLTASNTAVNVSASVDYIVSSVSR